MEEDKTNGWQVAFWILFGLIAALITLAVLNGNNQQNTNQSSSANTPDNLQLQNECINNAQQTDMSNPLYYSTDSIAGETPGWTLAGQEYLQSQTNDCKRQYPTN